MPRQHTPEKNRQLRPAVRWAFRGVAVGLLCAHASNPFFLTETLDNIIEGLKGPHDLTESFNTAGNAARATQRPVYIHESPQAAPSPEQSKSFTAAPGFYMQETPNTPTASDSSNTPEPTAPEDLMPANFSGSLAEIDVPPKIDLALQQASVRSGVDYMLLRVMSAQESTFRPAVRNSDSHACGLMQFIPGTQFEMVHRYGAQYGYDYLTEKINHNPQTGEYRISRNDRRHILNYCKDPLFSALMAAEYARQNHNSLQRHFPQRSITYTDIYMYHFLGPGGGRTFIRNLEANPSHAAKDYFSQRVVNSNRNVFYSRRTGAARSFEQIYNYYARRFSTSVASFSDPQPPESTRMAERPAPSAGSHSPSSG